MKISGIEAILPQSIDYKNIKKSIMKGVRRTVRLNPANEVNNFSYDNNRIIRFNIPCNGFLDLQNTTFQFIAQPTSGSFRNALNGQGVAFNNFIECIVNRLEIFAGDGNTQIESLHNYNLNATEKMKYMMSNNYFSTIGAINQGIGSIQLRRQLASNPAVPPNNGSYNSQGYAINFIASGIFQNDIKYLPLQLMSGLAGYSRSMVMEITLEQPFFCMSSSDGTPINYSITEAYMNLELIEMPEVEMKLMNDVKNGQIMAIPYQTADLWTNQVTQQGEYVISFAEYKEYLQSIRTVFLPQKNDQLSEFTSNWTRPDINNYQYKIKDTWYPTLPVQLALKNIDSTNSSIATVHSDATQFIELLKVFNKTKKYVDGVYPTPLITANVLNDPSLNVDFLLAQTLETFYNDKCYMHDAGEYWLDGVDTSDSQQVVFRMYLNTAPSVNQTPTTLNIYTYFDFVGALVFDKNKMNVIK